MQRFLEGRRRVCPSLLILVALALTPRFAWAQRAASPRSETAGGAITGTVTTQGNIPLGGAILTLTTAQNQMEPLTTSSDGDGRFRFDGLKPGAYAVVATLQGFERLSVSAVLTAGQTANVALDLKIAVMTDRVDVVAPTAVVPSAGTLTAAEGLSRREIEEITGGSGIQSALRLLASVIEVPGGLSIKGGRPSQATTQLGPVAFFDPATGLSPIVLPDDAIDSVTVLPNPYAVEYGRFSSGLVLIQTRRATDTWKTRINNLDPSFRTRRGEPFTIVGIAGLSPRFETGGPLIKDRVYLQQAAQYRYRSSDVASRPEDELRTSHRFSSFTRVDASLSARHSLVGAVGWFPASAKQANLGTFTPPPASVNTRGSVGTASVSERSLWSDSLFTETTVEVHNYETTVMPRGLAPMELLPETTVGNFFNRQYRATSTVQIIEALSGTHRGSSGLHMYKAGVDVLHSGFNGTSASKTVFVRRTDGTLARRLDFPTATTEQSLVSTDLAVFAQDRLQPTDRWYIEAGGRLDRDGAIGRVNFTPRIGSAVLLNESGSSVIRSGYGLFFERTPSAAGTFSEYESPVDTRYAADGVTPLGPPVPFSRLISPDLRTSRSLTWDLTFDQRFNTRWAFHVGVIDRRGSHELLVEPVQTVSGAALRLQSNGTSLYREVEIGGHYTGGNGVDLNVSYVRSRARADLNSFTTFFDNILDPIVGQNGYGPARADVPHRLVARGRALPLRNWLVLGTLDWRTGLPYSLVNEYLDFVGPRNDHRFPNYLNVDLGIEHRFTIFKYRPWIGVRADNAFSAFLPSDVQANVSSPFLGSLYNTEYRQFRIQVRFEP